jgi:hypothetical protein
LLMWLKKTGNIYARNCNESKQSAF